MAHAIGIITAITALLVALNHLGVFDRKKKKPRRRDDSDND